MTIQRVAPNNFANKQEIFTTDLNQLDINTTYELDKRSGQTDTLTSDITVDTGTITTFTSSSKLIVDPSALTIQSGTITTGAQIVGDNSPLSFGTSTVNLSGSTYTLLNTEYNNFNIIFTGSITSPTVTFPSTAGYTKLIDNRTGQTLTLLPGSVTIPPQSKVFIYCDGSNLSISAAPPSYKIISENKMTYASNSSNINTTVNTISYNGTSHFLLNDVNHLAFQVIDIAANQNDIIEINVSAVIGASDSTLTGSLIPGVSPFDNFLNFTFFPEAEMQLKNGSTLSYESGRAYYRVPNTDNYNFGLYWNALGGSGSNYFFVATPTTLTITQYRFS